MVFTNAFPEPVVCYIDVTSAGSNALGRFKEWGILDQVFRYDRDAHYIFFNAIAVVTQIEMLISRPAFNATGPGAHYVQPISNIP